MKTTITATSADAAQPIYTDTELIAGVRVKNSKDSTANLCVRLNGLAEYDTLEPGDASVYRVSNSIAQISVWKESAGTVVALHGPAVRL